MHDLRLALRALRATPMVSTIAVLSLALGIGANTAIFSLVYSLLLRTLPVSAPERLVTISSIGALKYGLKAGIGWNYGMWDRLWQERDQFDGAFAWSVERLDLAPGGETQPADGLFVDGEFFSTLGVPALLGRTFSAADDRPGGGPDGPVAVISYGLWQRRFGGASNTVGKTLTINTIPFTIIGVTPPEFLGLEVGRGFDVALPSSAEPLLRGPQSRTSEGRSLLWIPMLRLKPGQSIEAATAIIRALQPRIVEAIPAEGRPYFLGDPYVLLPGTVGTSNPSAGGPGLRDRYQRPLVTILVVVALVLLVACANIANLLLARASARAHEMSVRMALGASRWRLARLWLTESLLLSAAGAGVGLIFAVWGSRLLMAELSTPQSSVRLDLSLDWHVLLFTALVSIVTAVIFGTVPALRATRSAPIEALRHDRRASSAGGSGGGRGARLSSGLVVAQVALSLVLVVAAGLFVGSFGRLAQAPLGFDKNRVLVVNVDTRRAALGAESTLAFYQRLVDAVRTVPGVTNAAGHTNALAGGYTQSYVIDLPGLPSPAPRRAATHIVTPGWMATYGTPLRSGRDLDARDGPGAPLVALVNEAFVRKLIPDGRALGRTISGPEPPARTIVGVVGDAVYGSVREGAPPTMYLPLAQSAGIGPPGARNINISVRSAVGSPALLARSVAAALTAVDDDLAFSFRPLADSVDASMAQERLVAKLSAFFGGLALLLAGLGLYGVTAYSVSRRRHEIGIRLALGADPRGVVRLVLARVSWLVAVGVGTGTAASAWLSQFVAPLLYGLQPRDPRAVALAALMLMLVGAIAGWLPASRASRVDPAQVLRES